MAQKRPKSLFRYRPLSDVLLDREVHALQESYLFAAPFASMNDPMEAFYETGGPIDGILDGILASTGRTVAELYKLLDEMIGKLALISFSSTYEDLPLWAYYGSNFAGMCLEFDPDLLLLGDLKSEKLIPVTYERKPLPSISVTDFAGDVESIIMARIARKRVEWAHEHEWRYVTGVSGPKHYVDDALRRVYLGPRVSSDHAARIREVLSERSVDVVQGDVRGFELEFRLIQQAKALGSAERVGAGSFNRSEDLWTEKELTAFLTVPFSSLVDQCLQIAAKPNMENFSGIDISPEKDAIFVWTVYKLRSGRKVCERLYFDRNMNAIPDR